MSDDYDEIERLIDNDPIALGQRCRAAEAELASVREDRDAWRRSAGETSAAWEAESVARREADARVAQLEAALRSLIRVAESVRNYWNVDAQLTAARALLASQPLPSEPEEQ